MITHHWARRRAKMEGKTAIDTRNRTGPSGIGRVGKTKKRYNYDKNIHPFIRRDNVRTRLGGPRIAAQNTNQPEHQTVTSTTTQTSAVPFLRPFLRPLSVTPCCGPFCRDHPPSDPFCDLRPFYNPAAHLRCLISLSVADALQLDTVGLDVTRLPPSAASPPVGAGVEGEPEEADDQQAEHDADQDGKTLQVTLHPQEGCGRRWKLLDVSARPSVL